MGFEKFMTMGWHDYLSNRSNQSPNPVLHSFGVNQCFLRQCDKFLGTVSALSQQDFDLRYMLRRVDGSILTVAGSSLGNFRVEFEENDVKAWNMFGKPIAIEGNSFETNGSACYVISQTPLKVKSAKLKAAGQMLANPGFEDLTGDNLRSIQDCSFASWTKRVQRDPEGKIAIATELDGANGKYAVKLHSSGKGVYIFSALRIANLGTYKIVGRFKNISGNAKPYIALFDMAPKSWLKRQDFPTPSKDKFDSCEFNVKIDSMPQEQVAVIFGIDGGDGDVVLDDVGMTFSSAQALPDLNALFCKLGRNSSSSVLTSGEQVIRLSDADVIGFGKKVFGGIPFHLDANWLVVADSSWKNSLSMASVDIASCRFSEFFALGCVMCNRQNEGDSAAEFVLHYSDGTEAELQIRKGIDFDDWYLPISKGKGKTSPVIEFQSTESFLEYGLFLARLKNPLPMKDVVKIDLRSKAQGIVAIKALTLNINDVKKEK